MRQLTLQKGSPDSLVRKMIYHVKVNCGKMINESPFIMQVVPGCQFRTHMTAFQEYN